MTSKTLETWTPVDGQTYATEASSVQGREREVALPNSTLTIADLKWDVLSRDAENEITGWVKQIGVKKYIIFND